MHETEWPACVMNAENTVGPERGKHATRPGLAASFERIQRAQIVIQARGLSNWIPPMLEAHAREVQTVALRRRYAKG